MGRKVSVRRVLGRSCLLVLSGALVGGCLPPVAIQQPEERGVSDAGAADAGARDVDARAVDRDGQTAAPRARPTAAQQHADQADDRLAGVYAALREEAERLGLDPEALMPDPARRLLTRPTPEHVRGYIVERRAALAEAARVSPGVTTAARIYFARGVPSAEMGALLDGHGVLAKHLRGGVWTDGTTSGGAPGAGGTGGGLAEMGVETVTEALSMATASARAGTQRRLNDLEKPDSPVRKLSARGHAQLVGEARDLLNTLDEAGLPIHCLVVAHTSHAALARVDADPRVFLVDLVVGSRAGHWDVKDPAAE